MNGVKTISGIRHANLLRLIRAAGGVRQFAERLDRSYSQVSQLKNRSKHSRTGMPREIGDDMARHIEASWPLPTGWMDQLDIPLPTHIAVTPLVANEPAAHYSVNPSGWPFPNLSPSRWATLSRADQARVEAFALALVESATAPAARAFGA